MTETEAANIVAEYLKRLFPKTCPNCHRHFETLKEFYLNTEPAGNPFSPDLDDSDTQPKTPKGAVAISYCSCGFPIALTSHGMPLRQYWSLLLWARSEMRRQQLSAADLLLHLRLKVRQMVIAEA